MRNTPLKLTLLALLLTLSRYGTAASWPAQGVKMDSMSVAELEKAGDQARDCRAEHRSPAIWLCVSSTLLVSPPGLRP